MFVCMWVYGASGAILGYIRPSLLSPVSSYLLLPDKGLVKSWVLPRWTLHFFLVRGTIGYAKPVTSYYHRFEMWKFEVLNNHCEQCPTLMMTTRNLLTQLIERTSEQHDKIILTKKSPSSEPQHAHQFECWFLYKQQKHAGFLYNGFGAFYRDNYSVMERGLPHAQQMAPHPAMKLIC